MTKGCHWKNCDGKTRAFVEQACTLLKEHLEKNLQSIILHGSLAHGCYYLPKSDIDLLIIVKNPLDENIAHHLMKDLALLNGNRPHTGSLELSIILEKIAKHPDHPVSFELHFSEELISSILNETYDYNKRDKQDADLSAHLTVARAKGISLHGPIPNEIINPVKWENFMSAIDDGDLSWILEGENILTTPFYSVLNACRTIMTKKMGEGTVVSKEEGAMWALENFPSNTHFVILQALKAYQCSDPVLPEKRRTNGMEWDRDSLLAFRDVVIALNAPSVPSGSP